MAQKAVYTITRPTIHVLVRAAKRLTRLVCVLGRLVPLTGRGPKMEVSIPVSVHGKIKSLFICYISLLWMSAKCVPRLWAFYVCASFVSISSLCPSQEFSINCKWNILSQGNPRTDKTTFKWFGVVWRYQERNFRHGEASRSVENNSSRSHTEVRQQNFHRN